MLGQSQQPFHRVDQRAGGLCTQVGDVKGNETRIAPFVLAKHSADGRGHDFDVGHHDHHIAWREVGLCMKPGQQLVVQHLKFAHRAVRHFENDGIIIRAQRCVHRVLGRTQITDAVLQLHEQAGGVGARRIVKQVQSLAGHALLCSLQVVKSIQLANEVAPLPSPGGQQGWRVQVHLLKRNGREVFFFVAMPPALGPQRITPIHDVAPVVLAGVGHRQQHLAVRRQRSEHLQQLAGHLAHAKDRHASRHRAGQRLPRLQSRQSLPVQGGSGELLFGIRQSGQHAPPQFGLPQLVCWQLASSVVRPNRLLRQMPQNVAPFRPVL